MKTLEYFMAHAPLKPQDWFIPVMKTEKPEVVKWPTDEEFEKANGHYQMNQYLWRDNTLHKYNGDPIELTTELKGRVEAHWAELNTRSEEIRIWNEEFNKQRLLQWPLAWAQEQCKLIPIYPTGTTTKEVLTVKEVVERYGIKEDDIRHIFDREKEQTNPEPDWFEELRISLPKFGNEINFGDLEHIIEKCFEQAGIINRLQAKINSVDKQELRKYPLTYDETLKETHWPPKPEPILIGNMLEFVIAQANLQGNSPFNRKMFMAIANALIDEGKASVGAHSISPFCQCDTKSNELDVNGRCPTCGKKLQVTFTTTKQNITVQRALSILSMLVHREEISPDWTHEVGKLMGSTTIRTLLKRAGKDNIEFDSPAETTGLDYMNQVRKLISSNK